MFCTFGGPRFIPFMIWCGGSRLQHYFIWDTTHPLGSANHSRDHWLLGQIVIHWFVSVCESPGSRLATCCIYHCLSHCSISIGSQTILLKPDRRLLFIESIKLARQSPLRGSVIKLLMSCGCHGNRSCNSLFTCTRAQWLTPLWFDCSLATTPRVVMGSFSHPRVSAWIQLAACGPFVNGWTWSEPILLLIFPRRDSLFEFHIENCIYTVLWLKSRLDWGIKDPAHEGLLCSVSKCSRSSLVQIVDPRKFAFERPGI